jgi:hypothetical protein
MASAKGGGTTSRGSSSRNSRKSQESEVSPARWGGVALVIAAIVGAIFLAMISPSGANEPEQPGVIAEVATPGPSPTTADTRVPTVQPAISIPPDGEVTAELEIVVAVDIPDDEDVPKRLLDLYVYNASEEYTVKNPKPGTTVKVQGVRLTPGQNILTAALGGPGGPGPASEPIMVTYDEDKPKLTITSPKNKTKTYDDSIRVEFTSEVGAAVRVVNEANSFYDKQVVATSGQASSLVRLDYGKNHIVATSTDSAGQEQPDDINVVRIDGRPKVKVKAPKSVDPPETVRIVVDVTDRQGKPMPEAQVHFTLGARNQFTASDIVVTNDKGRAVWQPEISRSSSPADALELVVVAIAPSGDKKPVARQIALK